MNIRTVSACRSCGSTTLQPVLDLGNLAISDFLLPGQVPDRAPLALIRCDDCTLVQLSCTVERDRLYTNYHYRSGINPAMVGALADVVRDARSRVTLEPGDAVLDIGCNDGTLLANYEGEPFHRIGFDPSDVARHAWLLSDFSYDLIRDYFPTTKQHSPELCKIITAIACFYDVDDPNQFLAEVKRWLHPEGVLARRSPALPPMCPTPAIDNLGHDHLTYWSQSALLPLLHRHGLCLADSGYHQINGGSMRMILRHETGVPQDYTIGSPDMSAFVVHVTANRGQVRRFIQDLPPNDMYGIGASTKFNTLSQWYGLGPKQITAIGDRDPRKVGKRTVTGITIVSEEDMRAAKPDWLLCGAWQWADQFAEREYDVLAGGTKMIVPLPFFRIIDRVPTRQVV